MKIILGVILIFFVSEIVTEEVKDFNSNKLVQFFQQFVLGFTHKANADLVRKELNTNKEGDIKGCDVCKDVMYRMDILSQYSTEKETIDMILDKVCYKMASEYRSECLDIVKKHRGKIVESFLSGVKTEDICEKMEICKASGDIDKKKHHQLRCKICIKKVRMFERIIDHKQTPENVQKIFNGTCDILKPEIQKKCVNFYQTEGFQAIRDILKGVKPCKICKNLKFCRDKKEQLLNEIDFMDAVILLANISKSNKHCEHCQKVTKNFEKVIDSSKSLDFVIQKLSAVCSTYDPKYQAPCQNYFKNAKVLQYYKSVLAQEDPLKICQNAGACQKKVNILEFLELTQASEKHCHMVCRACVKAVMRYEYFFNHSNKAEDIQKAFNASCDILSYHSKKHCVNFYQKDGLQAIKDILKGVPPLKICRNIKLCRGRKEQLEFRDMTALDMPLMFIDVLKNHKQCKYCVKTYWFFERVINSSKTLDFVVQRLSAICSFYKTPFQGPCQNQFTNPSVKQVITSVLAQKCPWKICQSLGVCHKKDETSKTSDLKPDVTAFLPKFNIL